MKYISKAPFRIGIAGGGTDVSPYSDQYGGAILNASIDLYATAIIIPRKDEKVVINAIDTGIRREFNINESLPEVNDLKLQIGVYNRIVRDFARHPLACEIITTMDAPTGSGLGTSSTLVVACIGAFVEWLRLPLGEYDIAQMAVRIEREDLKMAGGKQDQYAATFGGMNFMEFYDNNRVIVNPLRIKSEVLRDLEFHLLLFYTKTQRESSKIIDSQRSNFEKKEARAIAASHQLKAQAYKMKEAILKGELYKIKQPLKASWENKKKLARGISNKSINDIYATAIAAGASAGKITGAGGGGFMIFYCPDNTRFSVIKALAERDVRWQRYQFQTKGLETWTSQQ